MQFVDPDKLNLEVVTSKIRAAGQGLINRGATIVQGTLIGPYAGKFVSFNQYKQEEKGQESGYAWLLQCTRACCSHWSSTGGLRTAFVVGKPLAVESTTSAL